VKRDPRLLQAVVGRRLVICRSHVSSGRSLDAQDTSFSGTKPGRKLAGSDEPEELPSHRRGAVSAQDLAHPVMVESVEKCVRSLLELEGHFLGMQGVKRVDVDSARFERDCARLGRDAYRW